MVAARRAAARERVVAAGLLLFYRERRVLRARELQAVPAAEELHGQFGAADGRARVDARVVPRRAAYGAVTRHVLLEVSAEQVVAAVGHAMDAARRDGGGGAQPELAADAAVRTHYGK